MFLIRFNNLAVQEGGELIYLVLDTSVLVSNGLKSRDMLMLMRLVALGVVCLRISEVSKREYLSRLHAQTSKTVKSIQRDLMTVSQLMSPARPIATELASSRESLRRLSQSFSEEIDAAWESWVHSHKVETLPIANVDGRLVLNDYFRGSGAFKSLKSRNDFPDAFIYHSILRLAREQSASPVKVVVEDKNLREKLEAKSSVEVFQTLGDFFASKEVVELVDHLGAGEASTASNVDFLGSEGFRASLEAYLNQGPEQYWYIDESSFENLDVLEANTWGVEMEGTSNPATNVVVSEPAFVAEGAYSVKLNYDAPGSLRYATDYSDAMYLESDTDRDIDVWSTNGDGACDVSELVDCHVTAYVDINAPDEHGAFSRGLSDLVNGEDVEIDIEICPISVKVQPRSGYFRAGHRTLDQL